MRALVLRAGDLRAVEPVEEEAAALFARVLLVDLRAVDLRAVALRALVLRAPPVEREEAVEPAELALGASSLDHLPDITRCAASATASAMIEPSLVALDIMLLAACDAVSAASSPASRILRRADGLALIAAAAAASPAASISLLIAALASLSTGLSEELDRLDVFRVDFLAIALISLRRSKSL